MMNSKETLLSKRWVLKRDNRETYYKIKDDSKSLKKLFQDTLGYSLIVHQDFIRLDKVPGKAEPWMGITSFNSLDEYQMFCFVLIYLEDKDAGEQFILSYLTEFIQMQLKEDENYWLKYDHRRKFVSVLHFCLDEELFIQNDGEAQNFLRDDSTEVLFENTGLSRYFMRNFASNIFNYEKPQDFMKEEWVGLQSDKGIVRKQRIYRRLMLSCGIYKDEEDNDDFTFIRRYRKTMQKDFNKICPCELQVYKSSAYLILEDEVRMGRLFPKNYTYDEILVLVMSNLRKRAKNGDIKRDENENMLLSRQRVKATFERVIRDNEKYIPAKYRERNRKRLIDEFYNYFIELGFIKEKGEDVVIYPICGKLIGSYEEGSL